jgi:Uma2 family endonuclease
MSMPAPRHRLSIEDWQQIVEAGVFREGAQLELLDGEIYEMAPIGSSHASVVDRLTRFWVTALGTRAIVRVQSSVVAPPQSQPLPDIALLRERRDFYEPGHPGPADILLIVEVADTSLTYDRQKLRVYATAGMTEVWIVDLLEKHIEIYREPRGNEYVDVRVAARDETVSCLALPDVALPVNTVFG